MKNLIVIFGLLLFSVSSCAQENKTSAVKQESQETISQRLNKLSASELKQVIMSKADIILLDVRTPGELASGKLEGAISIDYNAEGFEEKVQKLDPNKQIYVYCRSGRRSEKASEILSKFGFEVFDLKGGILSWEEEGYKIVKE
ncbi:rhodanese-like domain-containing protein [Xanthovirga aplysinae]|uniref:rhodanese-like domain-containing protein n=1 Tax=Xanthovirga aplysinae TaxID=2529853 RepID=UPI0012BC3BFA|nr:rhodanese-like domain-containing protein [Xanthovirga aplysinae]MTI32956.1 rhodanese-like domain-containing protein [Xanthovirga aplysinae]